MRTPCGKSSGIAVVDEDVYNDDSISATEGVTPTTATAAAAAAAVAPTTATMTSTATGSTITTATTSDPTRISTEESEAESKILAKRQFVIRELVDTEKDYVNDLGEIVDGYISLMRDTDCEIPLPEDLRGGKDKMVFGNIEAIYEWHRE